jgi:hypothetical protein
MSSKRMQNTVDHDAGKIDGRFSIVRSDKRLNIRSHQMLEKGPHKGFSFQSLRKTCTALNMSVFT